MGAGPTKELAAIQAEASGRGLLDTVRVVEDGELRWINGGTYLPEMCTGGGITDPCDTTDTLDIDAQPDTVEAKAFVVWAGDECSAHGFGEHDYRERARRLLESTQSFHIEDEVWTGTLAQARGWPNPRLADLTEDDLTQGVPIPVTEGLACLEQFLATSLQGKRGLIHATRQVVTLWQRFGLLIEDGDKIRTINGTPVSSGAGYPGTNPSGTIGDSNIWAYASPMMEVYLGPVEIIPNDLVQAMDRAQNTIRFLAHRMALVLWDSCGVAGVQLDIAQCKSGGS